MGDLSARVRRRLTSIATVSTLVGTLLVAGFGSTAAPAAAATPIVPPQQTQPGWLAEINWWRSFGASQSGKPIAPVTNTAAANVGPQNHVDYLRSAVDSGAPASQACTHDEIEGYPKPPVSDSHVVLACGGGLARAFEMWVMTPFHGQPILNPRVATIGAAEDSKSFYAAADVIQGAALTEVYTWPRNGGVMPRPKWWGVEGPDPIEICKPGDTNRAWGQPVFVWYPSARKLVSTSMQDAAGNEISHCALTGLSKATVGGAASYWMLFPEKEYTPGASYTASVTTTTTTDTGQTTIPVSFQAANKPRVSGTMTAGTLQVTGTLNNGDVAQQGGLPVTYSLEARADRAQATPSWTRPLPPGDYTVDAPAGDWYMCLRASSAMEKSDCHPSLRTVKKATLTYTGQTLYKQAGSPNPALTWTRSGWVGHDTNAANDVTGAPVCTTTATTSSAPGVYPVTCTKGSLASSRYTFTFVPGSLVVTDGAPVTTGTPQTVTLTTPTGVTYGDTKAVTASASSGLPVSVNSTTPTVCTVTGTDVTAIDTGSCTLSAVQAGGSGYKSASTTATFTVAQATLMTDPRDAARGPNDPNPTPAVTYEGFKLGETLATSDITGRPDCFLESTTTPGRYGFGCFFGTFQSKHYKLGSSYLSYLLVAEGLTPTSSTGTRWQYLSGSLPSPGAGSNAPLTIRATSGLPVTYASLTPQVCTVSGSTLKALAEGSCQIGAVQGGDATWGATTAVFSTTIRPASRQAQTVAFTATTPSTVVYGNTATIGATASSGLGVTYSTSTPAVCTVSGTTLTARGAGNCVVTASQAGNASWLPATATKTIAISKRPLTVSVASTSKVAGRANPVFTTSITGFTAGQSLATSDVTGTPACTTTATTSSPAGTYPITCTTGSLASANHSFTFQAGMLTVVKATQTVSFASGTPSTLTYGQGATLKATATSGLAVGYASTTPTVCTVSGSTLTLLKAGACTVTATQAGNGSWSPASVSRTITVGKAPLTVTADNKSRTVGAANPALTAKMTGFVNGHTPATSGITGAPACTTTATTSSTAGDYPITCSTGTLASDRYSFTFKPGTLTLTGQPQTLAFYGTPSSMVYGDSVSVMAHSTSGLPVEFSTDSPSVCTVSGSRLTAKAVGVCRLAASQEGDGIWAPATTIGTTLSVTKRPLTVVAGNAVKTAGQPNPAFTWSVNGFAAGQSLETSDVTGTPVCTTTATTTSPAGDYPISCTTGSLASVNHSFTFQAGTLTVSPAGQQVQPQAITITSPNRTTYGTPINLEATATSGLPVTFSTSNPDRCTVSGNTLTPLRAGGCQVTATQAGSAGFAPATANVYVSVDPAVLTVSVGNQVRFVGEANPSLVPTLSGFVNGQTLASSGVTGAGLCTTDATVTSPSGNYVISCGVGTLASDRYTFQPYNSTLTVRRRPQTVSLQTVTTLPAGDGVDVTASSTSGLPVTFTSRTPQVCSVAGDTITAIAPGTCTIRGEQGGDVTWQPAQASVSLEITPAPPVQNASPHAPFVKAAYQDFLKRQPTAEELARETAALDAEVYTRRQMLDRLSKSDEWVHVIVTDFYRDTLNREPDSGGLVAWSEHLTSGSRTVASVAGSFYGSSEYYANSGGTDAGWVTAMYRDILGRTPTSKDITDWSRVARLTTRQSAAAEIYQSRESRQKRVTALYRALLHREPDPSGLTAWTDRLRFVGDLSLAVSLSGSNEYWEMSKKRYPNA